MQRNLKLACITLDLEAFGCNNNPRACRLLNDEELFMRLEAILRKHEIKLTVFIVAKLLEEAPYVVKRLADLNAEFELHSYSHNIVDTDSQTEIEKAQSAYITYFGKKPLGYRAPWGKISLEGPERLAQAGFKYDSSIFPSFRPGVFNELRTPTCPFRFRNNSLIELPLAVIPGMRLVVGMSYLKFFGLWLYRRLFKMFGMPNPLVFSMHLHDFRIDTKVLAEMDLPAWGKYYHGRNVDNAFGTFEAFLIFLEEQGYSLIYMSELYEQVIRQMSFSVG